MQYKLFKDREGNVCSIVVIGGIYEQMSIPLNPDNTDYQAYLKWVEQGGVPTPADEVTV